MQPYPKQKLLLELSIWFKIEYFIFQLFKSMQCLTSIQNFKNFFPTTEFSSDWADFAKTFLSFFSCLVWLTKWQLAFLSPRLSKPTPNFFFKNNRSLENLQGLFCQICESRVPGKHGGTAVCSEWLKEQKHNRYYFENTDWNVIWVAAGLSFPPFIHVNNSIVKESNADLTVENWRFKKGP